MDPKSRIEQLVDDAAAGLRADPELWLDVRAELASHIEEAADAFRAQGKSEEESLELAAKGFGSPLDVAADLAAANRRRMKLRALARLAARALLVPAAVAIALYVCSRLVPLRDAAAILNGLMGKGYSAFGTTVFDLDRMMGGVLGRLPLDKALLLRGDPTRSTLSERQRAIWEAHPESKVYYGNYITSLLHGAGSNAAALEFIEPELRRGEALDPDNARYGIVLATLWMRRAAELKDVPVPKADAGTAPARYRLEVKDRALLDRAEALLVEAAKKPYYKTYTQEMLRERLALLPPARRLEDQVVRIAWAAALLLPDCAMARDTARYALTYGDLLVAEGKAREAEPFLDVWYPLAVKTEADAFTLIELLVATAIVRIGEQYAVSGYEKAGMADKTAWTRARAERLTAPFDAYNKRRKSGAEGAIMTQMRRSGSVLDNQLLPALDPEILKDYDLAPGRDLEQVLLEEVAVSMFLVILVGLMALCALTALRWRWAKGMASAPLLLLPDGRMLLRILILAVLLPLAGYCAYARWSGIAGREFGFAYIWYRFVLEMILLGGAILALAISMAGRRIRRRCESLGIPVPPRGMTRRFRIVFWAAVLFLWGVCLTFRGRMPAWGPWVLIPLVAAAAVVVLIGIHAADPTVILRKRAYGLYLGTVARSLIPVFAAAILVIAGATHPYLVTREAALVGADDSLAPGSRQISFTRAESLMVERLKDGVAQAAREIEAKP